MANIFGVGYNDRNSATCYHNSQCEYRGIIWETFRGYRHSMKRLDMRIRPKDFETQGTILNTKVLQSSL